MSTQKMEQFYPPIQSDGLNTDKAVSFGSTLAVTGNTTLSGNLAVTGTSNFTGAATFATSPTFTSGVLTPIVNVTGIGSLTVSQSGSTIVFTRSAGIQITLPVPQVGTTYEFVVGSTPTSGTHGILTSSGSVFLAGAVSIGAGSVINENGLVALANGTSTLGVSMNGTTTGGIIGTRFRATAISSTVWEVSGVAAGSGSLATLFY